MTPTDKIGNCTLYHADCMEVMKQFKDNEFDLAIVDPPYRENNQPTKQMRNKMNGKMQSFGKVPNKIYFDELFRISKNQIIWGGNNFLSLLESTNCMLFWYKHNPLENYSDGEFAWTSFDRVAKCFDYPYYGNINSEIERFHPTQKPIKLYEWLLLNYAKQGDKILDTHFGSLSIGIACDNLGFDLTAIELDDDYYKAACERLINHRKQLKFEF